jgi:CHAD domain-containing protein
MAFELTHERPLPDQLRRIIRSELRKAGNELARRAPSQDAIHQARKHVKKARAILRLLRRGLGSHYDTEMKRLRVAAHALASIRDVDAMVATASSLHARYPAAVTAAAAKAVIRGLTGRRRRVRANAAPILGKARKALKRAHHSAPKRVEQAGNFALARSGIVDMYRRARDAGQKLTPDDDPARFHHWRKRVKDLGHHITLFAGLHRAPRGRVKTLDRLEELLGDEHDLATLRRALVESPDLYGTPQNFTLMLGAIDRRQTVLRRRALALGQRALADKPREFRDAVETWWRG